MPIGQQPFQLPMNAVKKETSIADKVLLKSHDDEGLPTFWEYRLDRRIHTQSVKIKFYIVGFRNISVSEINLVARWCELEPYQLDFFYPVQGVFLQTYRVGFYPYVEEQSNMLVLRLQLVPHPGSSAISELYIEKITVVDSDFGAENSWFNDPDIPPIIPPIDPPDPGPNPTGIDPDPNNYYIFGNNPAKS